MTVVVDAFDIRRRGKGVSRTLQNLVSRLLVRDAGFRYLALTTREGAALLPDVPAGQLRIVPDVLGTVWEQILLPSIAYQLGAAAVYTHRECPAVWGPPTVVHVPEDPRHRWARDCRPPLRERGRRVYSRAVMSRGLRRARALIASTSVTADDISARFRITRTRFTVIPLGADDRFLRAKPIQEEPFLFHLGSADSRENTELVTRSYVFLAERRFPIPRLVIAGELGPVGVSVRALVRKFALGSQVILTGRITDERLAELYAGAVVTVQPSTDEGFGLQPLEALAAGSPLVAFDSPAVREIVGPVGVLVGSLEAGSVSRAVESLLDDPEARARLRREGPRHAAAFSWNTTTEAIGRILESVALTGQS